MTEKWVNVQMKKEVKFNGQTYGPGDLAVMRESMAKGHAKPGPGAEPLLVILGDAHPPKTLEELNSEQAASAVPDLGKQANA